MKPARYALMTVALLIAPALYAQSQDAAPLEEPAPARWWSLGFRFRGYSSEVFEDGKLERASTSPATSWTFTTTSSSPLLRLSPAADFSLGSKLSLRLELLFQRPSYAQVTDIYKGVDNPDTSNDERTKTTITERTKASLWEVPLIVRYQGVRDRGILSKLFVSAGVAVRSAAHIRTGVETVFPDSSTGYHETPAAPSRRNVLGGIVGLGFRFVDDFNIRITPEIRYTYWKGSTFDLESTRTRGGQFEAGLALTF